MDLRSHLAALDPVKAVYTDLDGTLLGRGGSVLADHEGRPDLAAVTALVRAREAGITVVAVSGRRATQLAEDVAVLGLNGGIAEAGAVTLRGHDTSFVWGHAPQDLGATPRAALEHVGALELVMDAFPGRVRPYHPWDDGRVGGYLLHGHIDTEHADTLLAEAGIEWAHVRDNGRTGGWPELSEVRAYHLIARGVGKAHAVAADLRRRGIAKEQAVAIGDSLEDETMAGVVGTYVRVANGHGTDGTNRFSVTEPNGAGVAAVVEAALAAAG